MSSAPLSIPTGDDRPDAALSSASTLLITQEDLALYLELCEVAKEKAFLRQKIMEHLDQGATVLPGALTVAIRQTESRMLTVSQLRTLLGPATIEDLRSRVRPTVRRSLIVRPWDADGGNAGQRPAGWPAW